MVNLITEHMGIWTAAQTQKANGGRGRGKKSNGQSPYGIKKLKGLILELAVRGKLVPQDPNDEPASVLLEKIAKEKARLVKEGKIKKQKSLPEIGESEKPFELPVGWKWSRLGDVTNYGISEKVELDDVDENTWILELADIEKETSRLLQKVRFADREFRSSKSRFSEGDVIYGKLRPYLDKVIVADESGVCTTEMIPLRGYNNIIPQYLRLVMKSPYFIRYANESTHGMNLPRMGTDKARMALFPMVSESEQHRIVAKVDELMALCDQLERQQTDSNATHQTLVETLLATLTHAADQREFAEAWQRITNHFDTLFTTEQSIDQLKQTILQLAVMGKLVPQDPNDEPASVLLGKIAKEKARLIKEGKIKKQKPLSEIGEDVKPFELPVGWEWVRLQQIIQISSGDGLTTANMNNDGGIPVFGGNGITGYHDQANVTKPTLVIGRVGYYCGSVHITPVLAWITDNAFETTFSEKNIYINFLYWLLKGTNLKENENATAQPVISGRKVYPIIVGLPPTAEQHRIVAKVDELMTLCDTLKTRLNDAQTTQVHLADAIVEQAVT